MVTQKIIFTTVVALGVLVMNKTGAQPCAGSWDNHRPIADPCVTGQWIGQPSPTGCPPNPLYTAIQTNTFTFAAPVNTFSIDFSGFDGAIECPRMEIRINGAFYPLNLANLSDVTPSPTCTGSFSTITVTPDGYLTTSDILYSQGRITIANVNASSVTVSTNDGQGAVFSNPFNCTTTVPLQLISFSSVAANNCKALIRWRTGIELNVMNIELLRSVNGTTFNKVAEVSPRGDNSDYAVETDNREDAFFRLKINDFDGSYEYSDIHRVKSDCNNLFQISPNPVKGSMEIRGLQKEDKVLIRNTLGQTLLTFNPPQNNIKFNLLHLAPGMYFVQIFSAKRLKSSLKFIKQ